MERTVLYQMTADDLHEFVNRECIDASRTEILKRCEHIFCDIDQVAEMHDVSAKTIRNYIKDGLIKPEIRSVENGKFKFRLSYALSLDFPVLKKELKKRNYV